MINELDKADMKYKFRQMYQDIGRIGALECLYEIFVTASLLCEVIQEESDKEDNSMKG